MSMSEQFDKARLKTVTVESKSVIWKTTPMQECPKSLILLTFTA